MPNMNLLETTTPLVNDAPITRAEVLALAGAFERSAKWLLKGVLQEPAEEFPLVGLNDYMRAAQILRTAAAGWATSEPQASAALSIPKNEDLQASLEVALHDIAKLQAEVDAKPPKPFPAYGQCETCGVFSDSAKALHDARRNCA